MNRPDDLNPIDWDTGLELGRVFDELAADDAVRVVAVTGAGRAFSAGGDMKKYQVLQRDPQDFPRFLADLHEVFGRISQQPKPFLALVNGIAVAGGIELMLSCDLAFASTSAQHRRRAPAATARWAAAGRSPCCRGRSARRAPGN